MKWADYGGVQILFDSCGYCRAVVVREDNSWCCVGPLGTRLKVEEDVKTSKRAVAAYRSSMKKILIKEVG